MTDAVVSQVVAETLRTNTSVEAQSSQIAVEVLRPNAGVIYSLSASAGSFSLSGGAMAPVGGVFSAGSFVVAGQDAALTYTPKLSGASCLLVGL